MICKNCNIDKDLTEFHKSKKSKKGYNSSCKICVRIKNLKSVKKYRENNADKVSESNKKYRDNNRGIINKRQVEWNLKNKDRVSESKKIFFQENKEKINKTRKLYYQNNKEKINKKAREYYSIKRKNNMLFKLKENIRNSINMSFKNSSFKKETNTSNILGCTFEDFKKYLESKFEPWMSWENHGLYNGELSHGWDIDHIIPLSTAETKEDIVKLNHYTNLQPLCSFVNRTIKRGRV